MTEVYNPLFVALSMVVAVLASFTALQLSGRLRAARSRSVRAFWVFGGAFSMGFGIWSMHFVGMLAMSLPIELTFHVGTTILSGAFAVLASGLALVGLNTSKLSPGRLATSGVLMGVAICGMHYMGMAAIPVAPAITYDWARIALSVLIAVTASTSALWLMCRLSEQGSRTFGQIAVLRGAASVVMGGAICGMHYTGMAAAHFSEGSICATGLHLDHLTLAFGIVVTAITLLSATIALTSMDAHHASRRLTARLSKENLDLAYEAKHDHLTELPNRSSLEEHLEQALAGGGEFAVMFLDLDGFKQVNDLAGHATGDWLLQQLAGQLTATAPAGSFVSRVSGDEFVLIVKDHSYEGLEQVCRNLLSAVGEPLFLEGRRLQVTTSIGVALFRKSGSDMRTLLAQADSAMYAAKKAGKNVFRFVEARGDAGLSREMALGLQNGQFELYFQPVVYAKTGAIQGAEALVRWNHPTRGLISPLEFIPLAESSGFIVPLGDWIFEEACAKLAQWQRSGQPFKVAVNFSTVQLEDETLPDRVAAMLARHHVQPDGLVVEMTETFAIADLGRCERVLNALRGHGVLLAMDDFGTGFSSLSHLHRLPVDELKIDRSFISEVTKSPQAMRICEGIIAMAHSLQLKVVAEGVETREQHQHLVAMGCDYLQGYYFARPMTWKDLSAHIVRTGGLFSGGVAPLRLAA